MRGAASTVFPSTAAVIATVATRVVALVVDRLDGAGDLERDALVVVRDDDGPGEAGRVADHGRRVADPVRDQPAGERHRQHAVGDHVGRPTPTANRSFQWIGLKSPDAPA